VLLAGNRELFKQCGRLAVSDGLPGTLDASTQFLDLPADFQSQAGAQSQCIAMRA
jgi:hypothetical protein